MNSLFSNFAFKLVIIPFILSLTACGADTWLAGDTSNPPLPGKRVSVLSQQTMLEAEILAPSIQLTAPTPNDEWPQAGGYANHAMYHMVLSQNPQKIWSENVGEGSATHTRLLASPIEAEGKVFVFDSAGYIRAFTAQEGRGIWDVDTKPEGEDAELPGGGIAYEGGAIFAATSYGEVIGVEAETGKIIWRQAVSAPVRSAPTVHDRRVFAQTADSQLYVLDAENGDVLWTHQGLPEATTLLGGSSPAVNDDVVIVAYASGELYALRAEGGNMLWQGQLSTLRRTDAAAALTDVLGLPIIDRGRVYAIGNANSLLAFDLRSGQALWEREIGGLQTPWIDGSTLFVLSNNNDLMALDAGSGKVLWLRPLQIWEDEEDRTGRIQWVGPLLASDRLIVAGSNEEILSISPYDGTILGIEESESIRIAPILSNGILYFLTVNGDLIAYR